MKSGQIRDLRIAVTAAIASFVAVLLSTPLSWGSAICATLIAMGVGPAIANTLAVSRGDDPSIPLFKDENMTRPVSPLGSVVGPLSFAGLVFVIWLAR